MLYRPTGLKELQLVYEVGMRAWPPRLAEQPIFYPVLNFEYAAQIARDWNTKSDFFVGYVTQFEVDDIYLAQFERQVVGGQRHEELWIPAEQLEEFNQHIVGQIAVTGAYFGPQFRGFIPNKAGLKGKDVIAQFADLVKLYDNNLADFQAELKTNDLAVFLNYPFWLQHDFSAEGISLAKRDRVLETLQKLWAILFPEIALPTLAEA